jgi:glycine cleavage system aminomethyltransferase T
MAGGLGYEVHGQVSDAAQVYAAIWAAGQPLGMRKLGSRAYLMNHTEDGFPQAYMHYPYPWFEDPGFAAWLDQRGPQASFMMLAPRLWGSAGNDLAKRYVTPFDTGWENRIHWDHEFTGKAALAAIAASPAADSRHAGMERRRHRRRARIPVPRPGRGTLHAARPHRPSDVMYDSGTPDPATARPKTKDYHADLVLTPDGQEIGISAGRIVSTTYRRMISLAFIGREHADLGTALVVLWGTPGTRQKPIRATVARFPYLTDERNDKIDVEQIPHYAK